MPEICEVIFTSQLLMTKLRNRYITNIKVLSGKYTHMKLKGLHLIKKYKPLKIIKIDSKGKFLWFELENDEGVILYMMSTFGMTGYWGFKKNNNSRIQFDIDNGKKNNKKYKLYYSDPRNFGNFSITDNLSVLNKKLNELAPDFLKTKITEKQFENDVNNLSLKRGNDDIVKILMAQTINHGLGSGIGNYLAPEILYHAKISPYRKLNSLSPEEIKNLYNSIRYIIKLCYVNNSVGYMEMFKKYIDQHKKGIENGKYPNYYPDVNVDDKEFKFNVYRQKEDPYKNKVKADKIINDRRTFWVPSIQK